MENKNSKLKALYEDKFEKLAPELLEYNKKALEKKEATNPLLIAVPDDYNDYKKRIMIFGQDTNNWCRECADSSTFSNNIDKSMEIYKEYYLHNNIGKKRSPFWNEFKRIKRCVLKTDDAVFTWNNINKIGRRGKGNLKKINKIQFEYFKVIEDEINLLQPNILLFFTGPYYDTFIKKQIGNFSQNKIHENIYELEFSGSFKGIKAFKTFHPNALYFKGRKIKKAVIKQLIKEIKEL